MSRLTSAVIDVEQQVVPTLVVSHVSILQCLMAYFRNTRVERCMSIEVPLHTVVKFTPVRGGGWSESQHPLYELTDEVIGAESTIPISEDSQSHLTPVNSVRELSAMTLDNSDSHLSAPIWGDGMASPHTQIKMMKLKKLSTS
jgi:hypothetical protein